MQRPAWLARQSYVHLPHSKSLALTYLSHAAALSRSLGGMLQGSRACYFWGVRGQILSCYSWSHACCSWQGSLMRLQTQQGSHTICSCMIQHFWTALRLCMQLFCCKTLQVSKQQQCVLPV